MLWPLLLGLGVDVATIAVPSVALLPVRAEQLTVDEVDQYEKLDVLLKKSLPGSAQDPAVTAANVAAAKSAGVVCALEEISCFAKLAVLDEVDLIFIPVTRRTGAGFHVSIVVVNGAGQSDVVDGDLGDLGDPAPARELLERATKATPHATAPEAASPESARADLDPAPEAVTPVKQNRFPTWGVVLLGAGGILLGGGVADVVVINDALGRAEPFGDRTNKLFVGQLGLVAAVVGLSAGAGGAFLVVSSE